MIPSIAVMAAFTLLVSLGIWQVHRLEWKNALLADIDRARQSASSAHLTRDDFHQAALSRRLFIGGSVEGQLLKDKAFRLGPRVQDGVAGYHLYAPMRLKDGGMILVNLGWIPQDAQAVLNNVKGNLTLSGLARNPDRANAFTPANQPEQQLWYSIDLEALRGQPGLEKLEDYVLYADTALENANPVPIPAAKDWQPPNSHLQYALFWFSMAGLLLVLSGIRLRIALLKR
jgi:surfeit locus 1 family protein